MLSDSVAEKVAILDFGAQYGKIIDRRVRECNVYSELLPLSTSANELLDKGFKAIIISGGPNSVYVPEAPFYDPEIFKCGLPVLGICYGFQLINKEFGGQVLREKLREDGITTVEIDSNSPLFDGLTSEQEVLLTHGDSVTQQSVAEEFSVIATSGNLVAGIMNREKNIYGLQFHPEVDLTENGMQMFINFLRKISSITASYTIENREDMCIDMIRKVVGEKKVLVMVSGGVDSTVCAALMNKALGTDQVIVIHIDNGFMRKNESELVVESLKRIGISVHKFNFVNEFLKAQVYLKKEGIFTPPLNKAIEPEHKRMIIGDTFIRCKDMAVNILNLDENIFLVQGTLRPDLIESASELASKNAEVIKTHHNDTALVRQLRNLGRVIEPLKDFHKDEVRELGRTLGLPDDIVNRHPFPGPGLAIRILCAVQPFREEDYNYTQSAVDDIIDEFSTYIQGIILPIKSVGVQGDRRSYSYVLALTFETKHMGDEIPWDLLEKIARTVPNHIHSINRVVYVFGEDLIDSLVDEITVTHVNTVTLAQLQAADKIVYDVLCGRDKFGNKSSDLEYILPKIQQMPVILVPIHFDRDFTNKRYFPSIKRSICLRPFITRDFMTGRPALPGRDIPEASILQMVNRILAEVPFISRVMIDLTSKPPGTTEWE